MSPITIQLFADILTHVAKEYKVLSFVPGVPDTVTPLCPEIVIVAEPVFSTENDAPILKFTAESRGTTMAVVEDPGTFKIPYITEEETENVVSVTL